MAKSKNKKVEVQGAEISIIEKEQEDYISLSDMVKSFDGGSALIEQWLRNKDTIEFLGIWERINNPDFKTPEFEGFKNEDIMKVKSIPIQYRGQRPVRFWKPDRSLAKQ